MPTVIHQLADAFLKRKQALSEGKRAKSVLPGSDYFMPKSAKEDLNNRLSVFEQGGLPELLKQAGKEMYENPIVNTAIGFTPGVGDVQAAGETVAALQRGAPWQETAGYAVGMLPFVPALRTTWHGSPHGFTKFDMSKIGTGEGAQAYGHGLYLAEARPVAEEYAVNLANRDIANQGRLNAHANAQRLVNLAGDPKYAADDIRFALESNPEHPQKQLLQDTLQHLESGSYANPLENAGYLYKVELPDEQIAKMLDWDKPFSEQPKNVQDAITKYWQENRVYGDPTKLTGEGIYGSLQAHVLGNRGTDMANRSAAQEAASMDLNYMGVPGIQYLDQASRGANPTVVDSRLQGLLEKHEGNAVAAVDEFMRSVYNTPKKKEAMRESFLRQLETPKTHNYVVFSDEIPKILERNGTSVFEFPKD